MYTFSDGKDYKGQRSTCSFPAGAVADDTICLSIPVIDNNFCDEPRTFDVSLVTTDPLARVTPGKNNLKIEITDIDNDCMSFLATLLELVKSYSTCDCFQVPRSGFNVLNTEYWNLMAL